MIVRIRRLPINRDMYIYFLNNKKGTTFCCSVLTIVNLFWFNSFLLFNTVYPKFLQLEGRLSLLLSAIVPQNKVKFVHSIDTKYFKRVGQGQLQKFTCIHPSLQVKDTNSEDICD